MQEFGEPNEQENPYAAPLPASLEPEVVSPQFDEHEAFRPFATIWTQPRRTVRQLIAQNPQLHVIPLACLAGVGEALDRASNRSLGDDVSMPVILGISCFFGPLGGLLTLWIGAWLIRLTGSWMGGLARGDHLQTAIAWANVPAVVGLPLWLPQLLIAGQEMFTTETPRLDSQPWLFVPILAITLVEMVLGIWSLVLLCNTIAEVQGYRSAWSGLGNLILAGMVILVPILLIAFALVGVFLA